MTYSRVSDVRREFKSLLDQGTIITDDRIIEYQAQMFAKINSHIGIRYTVPVTGTQPVNQQDTITFTAASGSGEVKTIKTEANGSETTYTYITVAADSPTVQRDALKALIDADKNAVVTTASLSTDKLVLESKILGFAYTLTVTGTTLTTVNDVVAVFGSLGLRVVRRIEAELTACKIAAIMKVKVAEALKDSKVRQDIKNGSCEAFLLSELKKIADGDVNLDDADQATSGTGLESNNQATGHVGLFQIQTRQW